MKNFNFGVKNFRAFDSNGVNLEVAPITILTGCNSSGKSSFVKAIGLLDSFLQQIHNAIKYDERINIDEYILDFKSNQNKILGNFNNVLNNKDLERITFSYTIYSLILSEEINIELTFALDKHDELNNGYLNKIVVSSNQGIIYTSERDSNEFSVCNFNFFKDKAIEFIKQKTIICNFLRIYSSYEIEGNVTIEEVNLWKEKVKSIKKSSRYKDILNFLRQKKFNQKYNEYNLEIDSNLVIDKYNQNNSIFYSSIVEQLQDETLNSFSLKINQLLCNYEELRSNIKLNTAIKLLIEDFSNSAQLTFGEYFHTKEIEYLSNISEKTKDYIFASAPTIYPITSINMNHIYNIDSISASPLSFEFIYEIIMNIEILLNNKEKDTTYYTYSKYYNHIQCYHKLYQLLSFLFKDFLLECLTPNWSGSIQFANSGYIPQKRYYLLDEENAFTSTLNKYFKFYRESLHIYRKEYKPLSFTNKWIKKFDVADKINIKQDKEAFGVIKITLKKDEKTSHLADLGLGISHLIHCLLQIEAAILAAKGEKINQYVGLSALDKYNERDFHFENQVIAIEEPESHLHPNYQSLLAEMFVEAYQKYNIQFIIETHSEYLIRKLQTLVADSSNEVNSSDINIHYFNHPDPNIRDFEDPQVYQINIDKDGNLSDRFGTGFFDEANRHIHDLLKIKLYKS